MTYKEELHRLRLANDILYETCAYVAIWSDKVPTKKNWTAMLCKVRKALKKAQVTNGAN